MYGRIYDSGMGPYPARVALGADSTNPRLGFLRLRGGIDPGDNNVRLQYVGVVDVWKGI